MRREPPDSLIFDLDGTLWDTCASCAIAWNNVLEREQISFRKVTDDDVRRVTGKPHEVCIRETFQGLNEQQIQTLIAGTEIEDNRVVEKLGGRLYDGVAEGLTRLRSEYSLFIVSNCQSGYIETFFQFSGLGSLFTDFECWGNTRLPKTENTAAVIARNRLKNPVFIGDAEGDRLAARNAQIPFYFAEYGFGSVVDCDFRFNRFSALVDHVLG